MAERVYNFAAGPAALPLPALEEAREHFLVLPGAGASVMEISHRSKEFLAIIEQAQQNFRTLLNIPDNYRVLFLQGGASLQFIMAPMNFLQNSGKPADYVLTGSWGNKAMKEAKRVGNVRVAWEGKAEKYVRVPKQDELDLDPGAAYVHFTSNETIEGVEFFEEPDTGSVPLFCDASSDILSRPIDVSKYGILYAGAQKNVGPSGVAVVIISDEMLARVPENLPAMLDYKNMAENASLYNTPPTFTIYMVMLVTKWLIEEIGGLDKMYAINKEKAKMLYDVIDGSGGFYKGHSQVDCRSIMNVTFRLPSEELEAAFIKEAGANGLASLKGHRSVGGCRASIYNAVPVEGVKALSDFMKAFMSRNG
ncbi:MAG TPA: 3-phosphoserine/phosphohydroxythreonine transaminase [Candidatus Hydrogenedentes bacterium]|nr:3-phosphoserine/phosphohydroxythreonine transaminase [Candidatus Hydrogenedentota bacterium]